MTDLSIHTERLVEMGDALAQAAPALSEAIALMDAGALEPAAYPLLASSSGLPDTHRRAQDLAREVVFAMQKAVDTCGRQIVGTAELYVRLEEANAIPHQPQWKED